MTTPLPSDDADRMLDALPTAHAVLLRLHRAGVGDEQIALALGVPVTSVPTLRQIALAKLAETQPSDPRPSDPRPSDPRPSDPPKDPT